MNVRVGPSIVAPVMVGQFLCAKKWGIARGQTSMGCYVQSVTVDEISMTYNGGHS